MSELSFPMAPHYTYRVVSPDESLRKRATAEAIALAGRVLFRPEITIASETVDLLADENRGPVVFASTHGTHLMDVPVIAHTIVSKLRARHRIGAIAAMQELSQGIPGLLLRRSNFMITVPRKPKGKMDAAESHMSSQIDSAFMATLDKGLDVALFPEGKTSPDAVNVLLKIYFGAIRYAREAKVPIIPMAPAGLRDPLTTKPQTGMYGRTHPVRVHVGPPLVANEDLTLEKLWEALQSALDIAALDSYGYNRWI